LFLVVAAAAAAMAAAAAKGVLGFWWRLGQGEGRL
jgi:hypothetical protein